MPARPFAPARRLLAVFVCTIFVPGVLLATFGARALWQEARGANRELRDRLDRGADAATRALADEITRLQTLVDEGSSPATIIHGLPADGSWAYVERAAGRHQVYPQNILPYELDASDAGVMDPELIRIERLEIQNVARAIAEYRNLLATAQPAVRPEVEHRLARALQKTGRTREAAQLWRDVERAGGRIGSLPADLVAGFELAKVDDGAAQMFYQRFIDGRWRLEKARYLYYSAEIRRLAGKTGDVDVRLSLADALDAASSSASPVIGGSGHVFVVFRRDDPFAALVVSAAFLNARIWPKVLNTAALDGRVVRIAANGQDLYASPRDSSGLGVARLADAAGLSWRIEVEPADAARFYAAIKGRTRFYFALLSLVLVSLASGGYFVARTVRRELEVARMKSEFVSTVSHEFRSPLTGIRQLAELLARGRVTDESKRHHYYSRIVHESERLARLIENVLDFSRMEAGRKPYRFEALDTKEWLSGVAEEFQSDAARAGYRLQTDIPERLPAISGDRAALSTAVRNLLDNACKYSPDSKLVWLAAEAADGGITVRVRDRGVGIPRREQRRIFEKFYRGGTLAEQVKGAGLGLSLVQHIVAAHHGEVRVESREGEGTIFSIELRAMS
jgi:signal transduction histidine kinase